MVFEVAVMVSMQVRCAIYTRKSSEEGLEQAFNSLEAQREACRAFVLSQKHEGWAALNNRYDDGGFSGGTMERPALKQLLDAVLAGNVDTVVVYKVDRLTRSLTDFAKIIEVFDSHGVSFVSVTQQFNTTTSMGRLTLNVLLSFAQFEREITGERIRDKFAASKKKGMWMGGYVPLGYDCVERELVVNPVEADTVRRIFRQYLRLGCVSRLKDFLDHKGVHSKVRTGIAGRMSGGRGYSRGALYHLLNNRIYVGEIVHRGQVYPGQHRPIVPRKLWDRVASRLQENNQAHRAEKSNSTTSLLTGRLFDVNGARFTPTHSVKNAKRYRYYTSQAVINRAGNKPTITRLPAQDLEQFVKSQIHRLLQAPDKCMAGMGNDPSKDEVAERAKELARKWLRLEIAKQHEFIRDILRRVTVGETAVWTEVDKSRLFSTLLGKKCETAAPSRRDKHDILKLAGDFQVLRRGSEVRFIAPHGSSCFRGNPAPSLMKAVARARSWYEQMVGGESSTISQLADKSGLTRRYVRRVLQCANLSPKITEAILMGEHRPDITLKEILQGMPLNWREQEQKIFRSP
jgi:site-specific DNA recombinase